MHRSSLYTADVTAVYTARCDKCALLAGGPRRVGISVLDLNEGSKRAESERKSLPDRPRTGVLTVLTVLTVLGLSRS